jgi:hypothetical protein
MKRPPHDARAPLTLARRLAADPLAPAAPAQRQRQGLFLQERRQSRAATPGKKRGLAAGALLLLPMLSSGNIARHNVLNMHCQLDQVAACQAQGSMQANAARWRPSSPN